MDLANSSSRLGLQVLLGLGTKAMMIQQLSRVQNKPLIEKFNNGTCLFCLK